MTHFASLGHVALRVKDVERSIAFYCSQLGLSEMFRLNRDNGELWLVYLRITDDQYLELFPDAVGDQAPGAEAIGINHFCLTVVDIEATVQEIKAAGIALWRPLKLGADGNRQAWILDPDGNRVEIMEMAANSMQAQAIAQWRSKRR